jgi:type I restriction enzyme S subunit
MWKTVKLGEVCSIHNGGTPKSNVKSYWEGDIKWLTPKDMGKLDGKYVNDTERKITAVGLNNSSAKLVPSKSIILSCRAPIGHVFINKVEMSFNQGCKGLVPTNAIAVEYLYYFLFSSKQLLNDLGTGATFKEISGKTLSSIYIPLPPLAEQQRIVAELDAAFAEIDEAVALTEAREVEVEKLAYLILNFSFSLSNSINDERLFSSICTLQRGFDLPKKDRNVGAYPLYSANGITDYIDDYKVTAPAVITGRSGTIGQVHYSEKNLWALNTALYVKDFKGNMPKYIYYLLKSLDLRKYASGAGVPTLNRNVLTNVIVHITDNLNVQNSTVVNLDFIFEQTKDVKQLVREKLTQLLNLKSSILTQALQPPQQ